MNGYPGNASVIPEVGMATHVVLHNHGTINTMCVCVCVCVCVWNDCCLYCPVHATRISTHNISSGECSTCIFVISLWQNSAYGNMYLQAGRMVGSYILLLNATDEVLSKSVLGMNQLMEVNCSLRMCWLFKSVYCSLLPPLNLHSCCGHCHGLTWTNNKQW